MTQTSTQPAATQDTRENLQRTLVLLKPDAVERGIVGEIIKRFEARGLQICGMKMMRMDEQIAARHYEPHIGKPFYPPLVAYMTSGPIVAMALEGANAVDIVRTMMGATNAAAAAPGTLRGDFAQRVDRNIVHGSDSVENGIREIDIFFTGAELFTYRASFTTQL